jgi:hypothetical protein
MATDGLIEMNSIAIVMMFAPLIAEAIPDQYLPELAKDYVYWRAKIILCQQSGSPADADKARQRIRQAENYLFHSTYTDAEAVQAIQDAEAYYKKSPVRGYGVFR